jgi:site-specific recombinase XerD
MNKKAKDKTRSSYEQALINLAKFDPNIKERTFEELDYKYIEGFDSWFEERGVTVNSRAVYYRNIRAVFNDAVEEELTDNYPFKKFKIKKTPTKKRNLSIDELILLKNFPCTYGFHAKYRDMFMLMFYMRGINAVDLFKLTKDNIRHGRIDYIRSKTGKPYSVKIEPEMQEIFDRYKGKDYLLDVADGAKTEKEYVTKYEGFLHRMNEGLKKIGPVTWSEQQGPSPIFDPILPQISQ